MITPKQQVLIDLDRKKNEIKKFYEEYEKAMQEVVAESGINVHFQDEEGIVYQVAEPEGKYVKFDKLTVNHTRRETEEKGSLSEKAAKELGYEVKKREKRD